MESPSDDSEGTKQVDRELTVLIADYQATREDQRQASVRQAAVLSAGIAVFAAFYYLAAEQDDYLSSKPLLALALPLAPYLVAQTYVWYEIDTILRGYYVRALERAIQEHVAVPSALGHGINLPSLGHLSYTIVAPRYWSFPIRVINIVAWIAVIALFGGSALLAIFSLPTAIDQIYALTLYAILAGFLMSVARSAIFRGARRFFVDAFQQYPRVSSEPLHRVITSRDPEARKRWQYLLMPRLGELIKWATFLLAWIIALIGSLLAHGFDGASLELSVTLALLYLLIFEYLIYQARYQWNDLRSTKSEAIHISREGRGRLPEKCEKQSFAVMIARILTAYYLVDLVFRSGSLQYLLLPSYVVITLPLILALPYEALREISDRDTVRGWCRSLVHGSIYLLVGFGFALRIVLGVLIGTGLQFDLHLAAWLFLAASLTGSAETLAIWAIEAAVSKTQQAATASEANQIEAGPEVDRSAMDPKTARIQKEEMKIRPDVDPLGVFLEPLREYLPKAGNANSPPIDRGTKIRLARDNLKSPWVVLQLVSIALAAIFGLLLAGIAPPLTTFVSVAFVIAWLSIGIMCVRLNAWYGIVIVITTTIIAIAFLWLTQGEAAAAAPIAVAGLMFIQLGDRLRNHEQFVAGAKPFFASLRRVALRVTGFTLNLLFGDSAKILFPRFANVPSSSD